MARLAIADPPYPPLFSERRDRPGGKLRTTRRSRAVRWYGDMHPDAVDYDDLATHRALLMHLVDDFDGWALATTPDGLGAYHPLPVSAHVMAWFKGNAMPGGNRLVNRWEPVIVSQPEDRRGRGTGPSMSDTLAAGAPGAGFPGLKPESWTHWVLEAMGYDPERDEVVDLFPGSGAVSRAIDTYRPR